MITRALVRPFGNNWAKEMDHLFGDFCAVSSSCGEEESAFSPKVNIRDTKNHLTLSFELPGMDKQDIKVVVKDGELIVSGQREFKSEEKDGTFIRSEIRSGKFSRSFSLPDGVNADDISADYKNGILEIQLTKREEVRPMEIEVKVS
jgi:HSP20 family protein